MDIRMPIIDGIECTKLIKSEFPSIKIIALTFDEQYETIIEMLEAGADGYLIKSIDKIKFHKYLLDVIFEKHKFTETISKTIIDSIKKKSVKTKTKLTEREIQFINFACSELSYNEIALQMNLSSRTIDGYRDSIYQKLNIKNRVGLVLYAIKNRVIHV
jgi:DNA-binding NarL/FixJ family response regulator